MNKTCNKRKKSDRKTNSVDVTKCSDILYFCVMVLDHWKSDKWCYDYLKYESDIC